MTNVRKIELLRKATGRLSKEVEEMAKTGAVVAAVDLTSEARDLQTWLEELEAEKEAS